MLKITNHCKTSHCKDNCDVPRRSGIQEVAAIIIEKSPFYMRALIKALWFFAVSSILELFARLNER